MSEKDKNEFGDKLDKLFKHFLDMFKEWVEDFEDFSLRKKKYADISPKFLDRRAKSLINAFDSLVNDLNDTYIEISIEYSQLSTLEKKQEVNKAILNFKSEATHLIQRINVKAEVLLTDFQKSPFSSEVQTRLEQISEFTYEDLIKKLKENL